MCKSVCQSQKFCPASLLSSRPWSGYQIMDWTSLAQTCPLGKKRDTNNWFSFALYVFVLLSSEWNKEPGSATVAMEIYGVAECGLSKPTISQQLEANKMDQFHLYLFFLLLYNPYNSYGFSSRHDMTAWWHPPRQRLRPASCQIWNLLSSPTSATPTLM